MAKKIDITGQKFGRLTVIEDVGRNKRKQVIWLCKCECGNTVKTNCTSLRNGNTTSCGCYNKEVIGKRNRIDLSNQKFGKLTVIKECGKDKHKNFIWLCECDCGNTTEVTTAMLRSGHTKSCGCYQKERASEASRANLTGKKIGRLTVIKDTGKNKKSSERSKHAIWLCKCECGNSVEITTTSLNGGRTHSCGCIQKEGIRERMTGKNHPHYNPNLTAEQRTKHRYKLGGNTYAQKWRKEVFERDDYTCQVCGDRNGNGHKAILNAHHLDGWNWCKSKRFDIDNGVTLCTTHHKEFHKIYGSGNNTRQQFEEYANSFHIKEYEQLALF